MLIVSYPNTLPVEMKKWQLKENKNMMRNNSQKEKERALVELESHMKGRKLTWAEVVVKGKAQGPSNEAHT